MNGTLYDLVTAYSERRTWGPLREHLLRPLRGAIIDVGAGTGAIFGYYHPSTQVRALEPNASMRRRAMMRAARSSATITVRAAGAEALAGFPSAF